MVIYSARDQYRDRMLIVATWLIGLGSVFLIKEIYGWEWQVAWPLFVIFVGVGTAGTALFSQRRSHMGMWGMWWPIAIIAIGIVLLLSTTGALAYTPRDLLAWWPVAVIALGIWFLVGAVLVRRPGNETESILVPLGDVSDADVRLRFGGGVLALGPAQPGTLISGRFEGGVINRSTANNKIDLESTVDWPFWLGNGPHWEVGISDQVPINLRIEGGATRSRMDLGALRIPRLELKTGASDTHVHLPVNGPTSVHVDAGVAQVVLDVPATVAARIRSKMALGNTSVDEARFPRSFDGWASADFDTSPNRVEIDIEGGIGHVRVQ